jgi:hypothetical protein
MFVNVENVKSDWAVNLIESVVQYAKDQLMPNVRKLYIDVDVIDNFYNEEGIKGEVITEDDRYFTIAIEPDQDIKEFITTLLHEMVHVKQYVKKELKDSYWKGEYFNGPYTDAPWEIDAYELEQTLLEGFLNIKKGAA